MIIGVFLRNFKTYRGINFIPITSESNFCGLLGDNGIGKSSILEALDCFFNGKVWNYNIVTKKSGLPTTKPYIVPVFLVKKDKLPDDEKEVFDEYSRVISESVVNSANQAHKKKYSEFHQTFDLENNYIIPLGVDYEGNISTAIFEISSDIKDKINSSLNWLKKSIEYIYIPREIDPETFTKLETNEIQVLMGETLHQILAQKIPPTQIQDMNRKLNEFIDDLGKELSMYAYRTPTNRQQALRRNDVYRLIIEAFFNTRKLHKKEGETWLEIGELSSGEKQKAIIDVAYNLLKNHRENAENLILAIDEPESSLHMSACFGQFDALYKISQSCKQVIFSSHWYGFFPMIESGSVAIISKNNNEHVTDLINLSHYREQVKHMVRCSGNHLPYDIRLKSINDFIQSVITSSIGEDPFNWLICEGSSERIYFSEYFKSQIKNNKLRIIPVGGAAEIRRIYRHLVISYEDFKNEVSGKIILISDTDAQLVQYETKDYSNLICKRIVNDANTTKLVNISSNPVSPKTEVEDALNGQVFLETLQSFIVDNPNLAFLENMTCERNLNSFFGIDLRDSERKLIDKFFDTDNNKFVFANRYVKKLTHDSFVPEWIEEIQEIIGADN